MKFVLHPLYNSLTISKIANIHFFEFTEQFQTQDDSHPFCELVYVASGELTVKSEDYTGILKKDEMIIHRTESLHSLSCPTKSPTVIIIGFECLSDDLSYFSKNKIKLSEHEIKKLAEIVKEGRNVFCPPYNVPVYNMNKKKNITFGSEQVLKNLLEYFLIQLIRKYLFQEQNLNEYPESSMNINEIVDYVDENFLQKITIDELAFLFCTNRSALCKDFKTTTGKTLIEYVCEKKIKYAQELILRGDFNFTEIAEKMNFDSANNFSRFFKMYTNITPTEYKKKFDSKTMR